MSHRTNKMSDRQANDKNWPNDRHPNNKNRSKERHQNDKIENWTFLQLYKKMYLDEETADVFFICDGADGETERIPAHKLLLSVASDVFKKQFSENVTDSNEIRLDGTSAAVFKEYIYFFYVPKVQLTFENIGDVMKLAQTYGNDEILTACSVFLEQRLTNDNIIWGYGLAIRFDRPKMKRNCEQKISEHAKDILNSNGFLGCDRDILNHILQMDGLKCDESQVLSSCLSWAKASADQKGLDSKNTQILRDELGDLLYQIRFRSMPMKCFSMVLASFNGLFLANELEEIIQLIAIPEFVSEKFNSKERGGGVANGTTGHKKWKPDMILFDRYWSKLNSRYYIRKVERVRFESIQPVLLAGFCCSRVFNTNSDIKTNLTSKITIVTIFSDGRIEEVFAGETKLTSDSEAYVELKEPIAMQKGNHYEIQLEQSVTMDCFNEIGLKSEADLGDGLKVRVLGDLSKSGFEGTKYGLVTKIFFKRI